MSGLSVEELDRLVERISDRVVEKLRSEPEPELLERGELATRLGLGIATIDRLVAAGHIPSIRFGRRRKFRLQDVFAAISEHPLGKEPLRPS